MNLEDINLKKDKLSRILMIAGMAAIGLIVAPIIFLTIQGIIGLAIAGAVGFSLVSFAPWFALKIANAKYRAIEAEKVSHLKKVQDAAAENPIETMRNLLMQKHAAFLEFKKNVEIAVAARDTFAGKVEKFQSKYPARAAEFQSQLERMVDLVTRKKRALTDAQKSLEDGAMKMEEMQAYWEMSKDAIALNQAAGMDTGDAFEKLKADTACDAVVESMHRAFAQLEVAAALEVETSDTVARPTVQLTHSDNVVLNVVPQVVTNKVRV